MLLIPATLLLFFNNSVNRHLHIAPNGEAVEVAHPFSMQCEDAEHPNSTSSERELIILSQIFFAFSGEIMFVEFQQHYFSFYFVEFILSIYNLIFRPLISVKNKAPPVCIFS